MASLEKLDLLVSYFKLFLPTPVPLMVVLGWGLASLLFRGLGRDEPEVQE